MKILLQVTQIVNNMKLKILLILLFSGLLCYSQKIKKDTIYIMYEAESKIIRKNNSKISSFGILYDLYRTKEAREKRLKYLREHGGGGETGFYFGFTGKKNFIVTGDLSKYELNTAEDISKLNIILGYGQKVFFIEKLGCNRYKFHETHLAYE